MNNLIERSRRFKVEIDDKHKSVELDRLLNDLADEIERLRKLAGISDGEDFDTIRNRVHPGRKRA